MEPNCVYVFLDEGGNFDFSPKGTKVFTLTGVTKLRPFVLGRALETIKYDLIEQGLELERFHASTDKQWVRDQVFAEIRRHLEHLRIDSLIVEKCKTGPALRLPGEFYPRMLGYVLRYIVNGVDLSKVGEVIVITDTIPIKRNRSAVEKAIKKTLRELLPAQTRFRIMHHASKSCHGLQVADYCNWAIYKRWTTDEQRPYSAIKGAIRSEFDIFRTGITSYY